MSAPAARGARSRRGRVLLVGEAAEAEPLTALLAQPPTLAMTMFEAIGEVTVAGAGEPIAALIIAEHFTQPPHHCAVEALRRIDPSVRVIALSRGSAPLAAGTRGVDAWLTLPLRAEELRRALDDDGLIANTATSTATSTAMSAVSLALPNSPAVIELEDEATRESFSSSASAAEKTQGPASSSATFSHSQECEKVSPPPSTLTSIPTPTDHAAPTESAAPSKPAMFQHSQKCENVDLPVAAPAASAGDAIIGDTDLIHALLHDPQGVQGVALRLIAHYSGWTNVCIMGENAAAATAPRDGIDIVHHGRHYGRLVAEGADPGALKSWAVWLGHWLALQEEHRRFRQGAHTDDLTGAWNRRFFESFLNQAIARARRDRRPVTLMVFDIDNFKVYNDQFGHEAGDEILREIVQLLKSIIRQGDCVCRIGGDEFVVVFADPEAPRAPGSKHPESVETIARRFHEAVCSMRFPKLGPQAQGTLSISAGLATYPWDGQDGASLLRHADHLALESKRRGKNAITLGPGSATG